MTCLMAIADEVLSETVPMLMEKPQIFVWYLKPPGLPLSVVAAAMNQLRPKLPIVIFSDHQQVSQEEFQTVDAIATVSSQASSFLPILQPFLSPEPGPVPFLRTNGKSRSRGRFAHYQPRVLDDLKAAVDSLSPTARRQVIAEFRTVLAELTDAA
jgi:hypothetical protein